MLGQWVLNKCFTMKKRMILALRRQYCFLQLLMKCKYAFLYILLICDMGVELAI